MNLLLYLRDPAATDQPVLQAASALGPVDGICYVMHNLTAADALLAEQAGGEVSQESSDLMLDRVGQQMIQHAREVAVGEVVRTEVVLRCEPQEWQAVNHFLEEHFVDLVLAESRRARGAPRQKLGDQELQLIRRVKSPLLLLKSSCRRRYATVYAALDPNHAHDKPAELDQKIVRQAAMLSRRMDCPLEIISVVEPMLSVPPDFAQASLSIDVGNQSAVIDQQREKVRKILEAAACKADQIHILVGEAKAELAGFVGERTDCALAMGAVSRSMLKRLLIGATAEALLERVECDVLVVNAA